MHYLAKSQTFKFEVSTKKCPCKNKTVQQTNSYFN